MRQGLASTVAILALFAAPLAFAGTAPRFRAETLSGEKLDLETLRKRGPVLLDFWATWCKPCLASLPEIEALHRRFGPRGLTVVGVSVDGPRNFAKVRPFVTRSRLTYPIVLDQDGALQSGFEVRAMPTTVLIDTSGAVVKTVLGYRPGEGEALAKAIEALLPSDSAGARRDSL